MIFQKFISRHASYSRFASTLVVVEHKEGKIISSTEYGWKCKECDHMEDETPYCDTCEFDMCPSCGWGEPMEEDRAQCEEHKDKVEA